MNLRNFEENINEVILARGKKYYDQDHIEKLEEVNSNHYIFQVSGTYDYTVHIFLTDTGEMKDTYCDCPYDQGEYCKHQVAAFYALRFEKGRKEEKTESTQLVVKENKSELEPILSRLNKQELMKIILDIADEHSLIEKRLLAKYTPVKDEVESSKKLIKEYIKQYKRRGFIQWNEVYDALQGANITLEKAEEKIAESDALRAVQLSMIVLSSVVEMLQFCDDSNGYAGDVIRGSLNIIHEAVDIHDSSLDEKQKENLYLSIMKEAMRPYYDDWSEWRIDLLRSCIPLCDTNKRRIKLNKLLEDMLKTVKSDAWSDKYETQAIKLLQLQLIEQLEGKEKGLKFIYSNLQYSDFRERAILHLLEEKKFKEVVQLCEEGIKIDRQFRGIIYEWKKYQLEAYEGLGDIDKQKEIMVSFLYDNRYEYYSRLKQLFSANEWPEILEEIVKTFKEDRYAPSAYVEILKEEKMSSHLLEYCSKNLNSIKELYPYLVDEYFDEVNKLFIKYIELQSEQSGDRKKYRNICSLIKLYKKVCGTTHSQMLIDHLKEEYKRRPTFIDELNKIMP